MLTNPRTTVTAARARQARQHYLQAMLQDREREMTAVRHSRVRRELSDRQGEGLDETELAEAHVQDHIEVALIQIKGDTLQRVREALDRLDAGEYGYCADCDGEISEKRLQALPFAVRCAACEESHERRAARERRLGSPQGFQLPWTDQIGP